MAQKQWKNWSGSVRFSPKTVQYPKNEDEVAALLRQANEKEENVRVVGSGHSFTALIHTEGNLISLDHLQGIIEAKPEERQATVWAGTKLNKLGEMLFEKNLAMENLGDIDVQSIAGALSTGTHGTGVNFGTLATQLRGLTLLTANGESLHCSETENRDIFKAAQVSLGSLGIITRMEFNLQPAYKLKYTSAKEPISQVFSKLDAYNQDNRNFEFYWFPYTQTAQTKCTNETDSKLKTGGQLGKASELVMDNGLFSLLCNTSWLFPSFAKNVCKISAWGVSTGTKVNWSHRIYATPRLVRFQEMEYNVPVEHFQEAFEEIQACIQKNKFKINFPIECRFVKPDDIWISPAYQREAAYIAVHNFRGMPYKEYFQEVETIFKKYKGRPHWGKLHTLEASELKELYPKWEDFHKIRKELDPKGIFLNNYLKKLFGES